MGCLYGPSIIQFYCRAVFGGGDSVLCLCVCVGGVFINFIDTDMFAIHMVLLRPRGGVTIIV